MAKYRETPCKYYICEHECSKSKDAEHKGLCQKCGKYIPRAKVRRINRKKQKLQKIREKEN